MTTEMEKVYIELVPSIGELKSAISSQLSKISLKDAGVILGKSLSSGIVEAMRSLESDVKNIGNSFTETLSEKSKEMNVDLSIKGEVSNLDNALKPAESSVKAFIASLGGASLSAIAMFGKTLLYSLVPREAIPVIQNLGPDLSRGLIHCREDLEISFSGFKESIASKLNGIGEAIGAKLEPITSKVRPIISRFTSLFANVKGVISGSISNAVDAFKQRFTIGDHVNVESKKVSSGLEKIDGSSKSLGATLLSAASNFASIVGKALTTGISTIASGVDLEAFSNKIMETISGITTNLPKLPQQFAAVMPQLVSSLDSAMPALIASLAETMTIFQQVFPELLPVLVEGITALILQLAPVLIEMTPVLLDAGLQLFTVLLTALTEILPELIAKLPEFINQISVVLIENLPLLLAAGLTLFLALVQAFIQMLPTLIGQLPCLIDQVGGALLEFLPQLGATALALFMAIVAAVPGILGSLIAAIGSLLTSIWEKIVSFASNLGEAAKNMMLGMIEGIKNAVGNIIGAIGDVCNDIVNNVKGFFGIHSPSTLMRKLFGYVGEGAALGLSDSTDNVLSAMNDMAQDVAKEASGLSSGISFGALEGETPVGGFGSDVLSTQLAEIEMRSAAQSPVSKLETAIERSGNSTNNVLLEISSLLLSVLTDIYNVIPDGESEWDFNRKVRKAIA